VVPQLDGSGAEALHASLGALSRFVLGELTLEEALQRILDLALTAAPAAASAGLTLMSADSLRTPVASDPTAPELDEAQYRAGRGPCVSALRERRIVRTVGIAIEGEYPEFAAAAIRAGIHSSLSLPLVVGDQGVGALNLYAEQPEGFPEDEDETLQLFAALAAVVIANVELFWGARTAADQMADAMRSRAVIEQAKGVLLARGATDPEDAFAMLVAASQRENRKLREIASEIVARASADL